MNFDKSERSDLVIC